MRFIRKFFHFWFGGLAEKCGALTTAIALTAALSCLAVTHSWPKTLLVLFGIIAFGYIKKRQEKE